MNKNKTEITPAEGLFLAAESADLALRQIDNALDLVAEQLLEVGEEEDGGASKASLRAVLCLIQKSAQSSVQELTRARLAYTGMI